MPARQVGVLPTPACASHGCFKAKSERGLEGGGARAKKAHKGAPRGAQSLALTGGICLTRQGVG
jgi:hypothetical protein